MTNHQIKIAVLLVLLIGSVHCYSQNELSLEELLHQYEKTFIANYPTSFYTSNEKQTLTKSNSKEIIVSNTKTTVIKKGASLDVMKQRQYFGDGDLVANHDSRGIVTDSSIYYSKEPGKDLDYITVTSDGKKMDRMQERLPQSGEMGVVLNGYIRASYLENITDIVRSNPNMESQISERTLDGCKVTFAQFHTNFGLYQLWLDPDMGHSPKKIVIERNTGDKYFRKTIGVQPEPAVEGVMQFLPNDTITKVYFVAYPIKSEKIGNNYFPVSAKIIEMVTYQNGVTAKYEADVEQNRIELNPDYEKLGAFKFKPGEVPNGTKVYFDDEQNISGLQYEWYDNTYRASVGFDELDLVNDAVKRHKTEQQTCTPQDSDN